MADVGIGELFEDGFGFGAKTAKTVKTVVTAPRRYFLAAQTADWSGYTPSIRVYVVLLAISSYFRYLYLGEGQMMTELYVGQFTDVLAQLSEDDPRWLQADPRVIANRTLEGLFFWNPFVSFAVYTLFGMVWMAYAEKLSLAVRIRYIYALLIPASVFMLLSTFAMLVTPSHLLAFVSFGGMFGSAIVVAFTAYLGAFPETEPRSGKAMRAIVLGLMLIGVMFLSTMIALLIGTFSAMIEAIAATVPVDAAPEVTG